MRRRFDRRRFLSLLGGSAALLPAVARAQPAMPVIGFLGSETETLWRDRVVAFRQGLADIGYVEGRNVEIAYRWAEGRNDRLPGLARELVDRRISVLVVLGGTASALAAKDATTTIPVVFRIAVDPVAAGLVPSLNRPGANITGVTTMGVDLGPKQLQLLHELAPAVTEVALLSNPTNPSIALVQLRDVPQAASKLGLRLHVFNASSENEFEAVFARMKELRVGGLMIGADTFLNARSRELAALASSHSMAAISPYGDFPRAGGLMSYGASIAAASRQAGVYVGRILKGEKPAGLPIQQPIAFEFILNARAARSLGITPSPSLLSRVDEIIE